MKHTEYVLKNTFNLHEDSSPIHFIETLSITFSPNSYSKRYSGKYNDCNIECIVGQEYNFVNLKVIILYKNKYQQFSYEMQADEFLSELITQIIPIIIKRLKHEKVE